MSVSKIAAEAAQQIIKEAELKPGYSEFHWNAAGISVERVAEIIQSAISQSLAARDKEIEQAIKEIANTADNYYCEALHASRLNPCLGWEAKAKCGEFGQAEYDAHKKVSELYGKHFGIHEAIKKLRALLKGKAI